MAGPLRLGVLAAAALSGAVEARKRVFRAKPKAESVAAGPANKAPKAVIGKPTSEKGPAAKPVSLAIESAMGASKIAPSVTATREHSDKEPDGDQKLRNFLWDGDQKLQQFITSECSFS